MTRTPEENNCPDYSLLDGEFEDNRPLVCGESPYGDDDEQLIDQTNEERKVICANELVAENRKKEAKECL